MIEIERYAANGDKRIKRLFPVYTRAEADERKLDCIYWRDVKAGDIGRWCLSDDGFVSQIRKVYPLTCNSVRVVCPAFDYFTREKKPLLFEDIHAAKAYSRGRRIGWKALELKSGRLKRMVQAYVAMMTTTGKIDLNKLGDVYRKDEAKPYVTVSKLLKMEEVQKMIRAELRTVYNDNDVNEDFVVKLYKEACEIAKRRNNALALKGLVDTGIKLLDMDPKEPTKIKGMLGSEDADGNKLISAFEGTLAELQGATNGGRNTTDIEDVRESEDTLEAVSEVPELQAELCVLSVPSEVSGTVPGVHEGVS